MMTEQFEVYMTLDDAGKIESFEAEFRKELETSADLKVETSKRARPLGMSGTEIAIGFLVSVLGSLTANALQSRVDAALKRLGEQGKRIGRVTINKLEGQGKSVTKEKVDP